MQSDAEVKIVSTPKIHDQFGRTEFLAKKQSSKKRLVGLGIIIVSLMTFLGGQKKRTASKVEALKIPQVKPSPQVVLPIYSVAGEVIESSRRPKIHRVVSFSGPQVFKRPLSEQIPPGSMVQAKLVSGASDGLVKAISTEDLQVVGNEIIPSGSIFVGDGASSKHRLNVRFTEVVFPDGTVQKIQAIAADSTDKIAGLKGSKINQYGLKLAAGAGLHFVSGLSQGLRKRDVINGVAVDRNDMGSAALSGTSQAAAETSKEVLGQLKSDQTVITIPSDTAIFVLFSGN